MSLFENAHQPDGRKKQNAETRRRGVSRRKTRFSSDQGIQTGSSRQCGRTFLYAACFVRLVNSCTPAGSLFVRFGSFSRRLGVSAICFMGHRFENPASRTPPSGPIRLALGAHPSACACMAFSPCFLGELGALGGTCRCRAGSIVWARSRPLHPPGILTRGCTAVPLIGVKQNRGSDCSPGFLQATGSLRKPV
jgi:hypothetical protein